MANNKNIRSLTLCAKHNGKTCVPILQLSGVWLDQLGFDIGRKVEITQSKGQLIIKAGGYKYKRSVK